MTATSSRPVRRASAFLLTASACFVWALVGATAARCDAPSGPAGSPTRPLAQLDELAFVVEPALGLPSPTDLLGHRLGERFSSGEQILELLDAIDVASERVTVVEYGRTVEGRPLRLAVLGRPDHIARLDAVLAARRRGDPQQPALLWLAAGVHGDEASSAEAALAVLYALAAASPSSHSELATVLDDLLVVVDPNVNPDGRARYVGWLRGVSGAAPDPDPEALEHRPPWPDGRTNHYLFDLNRDWAWATQVETRQRLAAMSRFEPEVYVDLHEMGAERTYFFPPAADPVHPAVPEGALAWLDVFGRANAAAFDKRSWLYFVRDVYDLFYPAYGDTYPILRGGVGMTFEMAGGERAGLALELPSGSLLTLADRVARHTVAALTTVRTAAQHARALRRDAILRRATPAGATWLWRADQPEARALAELLARHGIPIGRLTAPARLQVEPAPQNASAPVHAVERELAAGTWAVTARGAARPLVEALMSDASFEPDFLARQQERLDAGLDTEIYDVTAWALPLAYGLEAWTRPQAAPLGAAPKLAVETVDPSSPWSTRTVTTYTAADTDTDTDTATATATDTDTDTDTGAETTARSGSDTASQPLGWIVPPSGLSSYRFAAALLADGLTLRWATEALDRDPAGSLFVARSQRKLTSGEAVRRRVERAARSAQVEARPTTTSWADDGASLGGIGLVPVRQLRVGLVGGEGVSATDHGALWHLLDRELGVAPSRRDLAHLDQKALSDLDVLLLPHGDGYAEHTGQRTVDALRPWLEHGGVLIATGGAAEWLIEVELLELEVRTADPSLDVPGVALATTLGEHPLGIGRATPPPTLVLSDLVFEPTGDPQVDILRVRDQHPLLAGTAWPGAEDHLAGALLVARRSVGDGHIVAFAQPPAFRGMWRATMPLLLDAVLYLPWL